MNELCGIYTFSNSSHAVYQINVVCFRAKNRLMRIRACELELLVECWHKSSLDLSYIKHYEQHTISISSAHLV